jgi:hypothetical protein
VAGKYPIEGTVIGTSEGDGNFDLSASELFFAEEPAEVDGRLTLLDASGKLLRLQP